MLKNPTNSCVRGLVLVQIAVALATACSSSSQPGSDAATDSRATDVATDARATDTTTDTSATDVGNTTVDAPSTDVVGPPADVSTTGWTFQGGSVTVAFTGGTAPGVVTIPAGGDVSAAIGLQFTTPTSNGSITFSTAENACCGLTTNDVSPATLPSDNASSSNNPVLYLSFYNPGSSPITFGTMSPSITFSPTSGGTLAGIIPADIECQLDIYQTSMAGGSWMTLPGASVSLTAGATHFTIPSAAVPGGGMVSFAPGQTIAAISCD